MHAGEFREEMRSLSSRERSQVTIGFSTPACSAGPQPIFGLAMACADWVQPGWDMRGPRPGGSYGMQAGLKHLRIAHL